MEIAPASPFKVILIGNYEPDGQESMLRFCYSLAEGLKTHGIEVRVLSPEPILGRVSYRMSRAKGLAKWLGYIDKFILFPEILKKNCHNADIVHVCDHSNAMYLRHLKARPHLITCHDLLAVRASLGESTYCPVTPLGKILQRIILENLKSASLIVCDSNATKRDVERLVNLKKSRIRLVPLGLNYPYSVLDQVEAKARLLGRLELASELPFLLHVGSSEPRKNRDGILRIFKKLKSQFKGKLVFAGGPLTADLRLLVDELGLRDDVIEIVAPDNRILEALYNCAFALIYPSRSEGFGWPIIEAQACGCPVVTSNCGPCPEVAGLGAFVNDIDDEDGFVTSILRLKEEHERSRLVQAGFLNLKNYDMEKTVSSYLDIYEELLQERSLAGSPGAHGAPQLR